MNATIRPYRDNDKAAVYDVCVRTANAGRGVRGRYSRPENVDARRFYERLGWRQIEVSDPGPGVYLVRPTSV